MTATPSTPISTPISTMGRSIARKELFRDSFRKTTRPAQLVGDDTKIPRLSAAPSAGGAAMTAVCTSASTPNGLDSATAENAIPVLWGEAWNRLRVEYPDLDDRWALVERCPSVARAMAAAGREAGRCQRGSGDLAELENRLRAFEVAVLKSMAADDHAKSERLCLDCGSENVPTVAPKLTGARTCMKCAGEATP